LIIAAVLHLIPISLIIRGEESLLLWIFILKNQYISSIEFIISAKQTLII